MKKFLLLLIVFTGFSMSLMAQKVVTGKVTDEQQTPLPGVSVQVKGTTIGTLTDSEGQFRLQIPVDVRILSFSFIGMKPQEIEIGTQTSFSVVMQVDVGLLEEVIVIGYGTVKKKDLTGAVSRIDAEDLATEATSNAQGCNSRPGSEPQHQRQRAEQCQRYEDPRGNFAES